jgi:hypothetical protein
MLRAGTVLAEPEIHTQIASIFSRCAGRNFDIAQSVNTT